MQNIMSLLDVDDFHCLIYGVAGTGKTHFAAGHPGKVFFVDCDDGMRSIFYSDIISPEHKKQIYYETVLETFFDTATTSVVTPTAYTKVNDIFDSLLKTGTWEGIAPKTVVLDSLTTLSDYALIDVLGPAGRLNADKITQPEWGKQIRKIANIISKGRSLKGINFICTAHEQYKKDEFSGRIWCQPLTTGSFALRIPGYFDEFYHATTVPTVKGTKYILETRASGLITARTRLNLPEKIDSDYNVIKDYLTKRREKYEVNPSNQKIGGN